MQPQIKSGIEYALIALLAAALCMWQLIAGAQMDEPATGKVVMMALGLIVAGAMHCVFMMQLVRHTARPFWPWFVAVVIFMPIGSAVLLAVLLSEADASES
jgi:hypothetical protein